MQRLRFFDLRLSRLPRVIGACSDDIPRLAEAVNTAQQRLLYAKEAGDEGWWGTWAEVAFNVDRTNPFVTLPREMARLELMNVCNRPVAINNQFFEYLEFGNGRMPKRFINCPGLLQTYSRNNVVTFTDLSSPPQLIIAYLTDPADAGKRVLIQGKNNVDSVVYSQDGTSRVTGVYITLQSPWATTPYPFNSISGIQKDVTNGEVQIFQMSPTTGAQVLLLTMQPTETTASYRRYFLNPLPLNCCAGQVSPCPTTILPAAQATTVQVTAIAKLELIPVRADPDYTLIQNMEAIIEEAASARYSEIDTPSAKSMAAERHVQAIRLLNGELAHYVGIDTPAVNFAPFGSAKLERRRIGTMI